MRGRFVPMQRMCNSVVLVSGEDSRPPGFNPTGSKINTWSRFPHLAEEKMASLLRIRKGIKLPFW